MTFKASNPGAARRPRPPDARPPAAPAAGVPRYLRPGAAAPGGPSRGDRLPASAPGDASEREADRVAGELVDARPEAAVRPVAVGAAAPALRREAADGAAAAAPGAQSGGPGANDASSHGASGLPLPPALAARYGTRLGQDLSSVRVHAGSEAAASARAAQARAYTVGGDIVFGQGEYAPGTPRGERLLAHEVAHVAQQARGGGAPALMREPTPDAGQKPNPAPQPSAAAGLEALPLATRQALKIDTDEAHGQGTDLKNFFGLTGSVVTADNVDADYELVTPTIDALSDAKAKSGLYKGLRAYAQSVFDLLPDDKGKAKTSRLNLVHHVNLDLSRWGGPSAAFRFTAVGATKAGRIGVKILVEEQGAPFEPMSASAAGVEAAKATPNALTRNSLLPEKTWQRVLRALDRIPAATLARIHDIEFDTSGQARGGDGEAAEYFEVFKDGKWTRRIVLYRDLLAGGDETFALTLVHEVGHALDFAPAQGAKGPEPSKEAHREQAFRDAVQKDGGRARAVTAYGATSDKELYAESFALYTQRPATLKALRPSTYAYFESAGAAQAAPAAKP